MLNGSDRVDPIGWRRIPLCVRVVAFVAEDPMATAEHNSLITCLSGGRCTHVAVWLFRNPVAAIGTPVDTPHKIFEAWQKKMRLKVRGNLAQASSDAMTGSRSSFIFLEWRQ